MAKVIKWLYYYQYGKLERLGVERETTGRYYFDSDPKKGRWANKPLKGGLHLTIKEAIAYEIKETEEKIKKELTHIEGLKGSLKYEEDILYSMHKEPWWDDE